MSSSSEDDPEDVEIHPMYEVAARIDELFSVPVYRNPQEPLIESWREIGERLLALGKRHLEEGVDAAGKYLEEKLAAQPKRRRRRRVKRRIAAAPAPPRPDEVTPDVVAPDVVAPDVRSSC